MFLRYYWRDDFYANTLHILLPFAFLEYVHAQYCESDVYTTWEQSAGETVKVAFQCRQLDGTYTVGQETIDAGDARIDDLFDNNEVEWYTNRIGSIVLYGLLIKVKI